MFMVDVWVAGLLREKKICSAASATFSRPSPRKSVAHYANEAENFVPVVLSGWRQPNPKTRPRTRPRPRTRLLELGGSIFAFGEPASPQRQLVMGPRQRRSSSSRTIRRLVKTLKK